jgi:PAS domain S-box-containing protein
VLITTGHGDEETAINSMEAGAEAYFVKGEINKASLIRTILYTIEKNALIKRMEASELKLRMFLNSAADAFIICDPEMVITDINPAAIEMCGPGLKKDEILGRNMKDAGCTGIFIPYDKYQEVISTGKPYSSEISYNDPIAGEKVISVKAFKSGMSLGVAGHDITETKLSEKILRSSYEKLKEIDAFKFSFLSMVSHELKTPLTAIKGFIGALIKGVAGEVNEVQTDYLKIIKNNADRLLVLVNELLDFSRLESGTFRIEKRLFDLRLLIENCTSELVFAAKEKGVSIDTKLPEGPVELQVDPVRMTQAVQNLIINSIKFAPENSTVRVELKKNIQGDLAVITVSDCGPGIEKKNLSRIFERFYQVDNIKASGFGLGLGLSIAKNIVESHDGTIRAESEGPGTGALFVIHLPLAKTKKVDGPEKRI